MITVTRTKAKVHATMNTFFVFLSLNILYNILFIMDKLDKNTVLLGVAAVLVAVVYYVRNPHFYPLNLYYLLPYPVGYSVDDLKNLPCYFFFFN